MIRFMVAGLLVASSSVAAQTQIPNVFEDGTPATAAAVNENFQYVLENASGGCSATQQDNSVVIECADGTSGVIAGAGTIVVVPPDGILGQVPETYPSGPIVVLDANAVLLGEGRKFDDEFFVLTDTEHELMLVDTSVRDPTATEVIPVSTGGVNRSIFFTEPNCEGLATAHASVNDENEVVVNSIGYFVIAEGSNSLGTTLFESIATPTSRRSDMSIQEGYCANSQNVYSGTFPATKYIPAEEIVNAIAPLRLGQLP